MAKRPRNRDAKTRIDAVRHKAQRESIPAERLPEHKAVVPVERIERSIRLIRGHKVMLSPDLASLYAVQPRALVQAVKRNIERFPKDFMFQLTRAELADLKSQTVTSSWGGARRAPPYAFTEQGVAMLSSVLRSPRAVRADIENMRVATALRARRRRVLSSGRR